MPSVEQIQENASLIKGFLKPLFYDEWNRPDQPAALTHEDFCKVRDGYACSRCFCEYTTYLVKCPVCGWERDLAKDLAAPDPIHVEHLREREETVGQDLGGMVRSFEEFMKAVEADKNIDHVPLEKLGPSKWGKK